jgi:hypothetical protein
MSTNTSTNTVTVKWLAAYATTASADPIQFYELEKSSGSNIWSHVDTISAIPNKTTYIYQVDDISPLMKYYFRVRALTKTQKGPWSTIKSSTWFCNLSILLFTSIVVTSPDTAITSNVIPVIIILFLLLFYKLL